MQMENVQGRCMTITVCVGLTDRENQIAGLLAAGKSNMEVAAQLGISYHTVSNHIKNIRNKTGTNGQNRVVLLSVVRG